MPNNDDKLVGLMAEVTNDYFGIDNPYPPSIDGTDANGVTFRMFCKKQLSVVKQNIHLVAKVCPECKGTGSPVGLIGYKCVTCKGHGVVPINEEK